MFSPFEEVGKTVSNSSTKNDRVVADSKDESVIHRLFCSERKNKTHLSPSPTVVGIGAFTLESLNNERSCNNKPMFYE